MENDTVYLWQRIINILSEFGLNENAFCIGNGAMSGGSEIAYRPSRENIDTDNHKYAIQYCEFVDVICIWEIQRRIELDSSLNLIWNGLCWNQVNEPQTKVVKIANSYNEYSAVAVMPISFFPIFLSENTSFNFEINTPCVPESVKNEEYHIVGTEGEKIKVYSTRYERDPALRQRAIEIHGYNCQACGFNFNDTYGEKYIEVHHLKPLHTFDGLETVDPKTDMVCLCSNCHRMVHHQTRVLTIEELKEAIKLNSKNNEYMKE